MFSMAGEKQHAKGKQEKEKYVCNTSIGESDVKPSHYYYNVISGCESRIIYYYLM
jgi:hypothetical protein